MTLQDELKKVEITESDVFKMQLVIQLDSQKVKMIKKDQKHSM